MPQNTDFFPDSAGNYLEWARNARTVLTRNKDVLKLTAAEFARVDGLLATGLAAAQKVVDAQAALDSAFEDLADTRASEDPQLRECFNAIKASPECTPGLAGEIGIVSHATAFDAASYQPELNASARAGFVELRTFKRGVQAMNYHSRLAGETEWKLILAARHKSPVRDDRPLAKAGTPEVREYCCAGLIDDEEVGRRSDIVSVTFAG